MREPAALLRVAVADDEPVARSTLRNLLSGDAEIELVAECENGAEAVAAVRDLTPDLLFLDVQMPGMTGFDVIRELGEDAPVIVFVTAYDRYALKAFEVHAIDYLLKPFDDERFAQALERAKAEVRKQEVVGMGRKLADLIAGVGNNASDAPKAEPLRRLAIHREGRVEMIAIDAVIWIEAADQYVQIHTADGEALMRESLSHLERALDPERFLRVHRSAIVAVDRIQTLEKHGAGGRLRLDTGAWVPVSRSRMAELRAKLG